MILAEFGTGQVFLSMMYFFLFFIWIWLLIVVFGDIFRSHDLGGLAKALWVIFVIVVPYLGVFVYLIARGHKMSEHAAASRPGAGRRAARLHPERRSARTEHGRRAGPTGRSQGQGRHLRRRVRAGQGQGDPPDRTESPPTAQRNGVTMTETSLDELGPVDYVVVEFPAGATNFTGEMATELLALVDAGTIRVIDVLILTKDDDGTVDATELSDVDELGELQALEAELAELLAADDVAHLAAAMDPGRPPACSSGRTCGRRRSRRRPAARAAS